MEPMVQSRERPSVRDSGVVGGNGANKIVRRDDGAKAGVGGGDGANGGGCRGNEGNNRNNKRVISGDGRARG